MAEEWVARILIFYFKAIHKRRLDARFCLYGLISYAAWLSSLFPFSTLNILWKFNEILTQNTSIPIGQSYCVLLLPA